MSQPPTPHPPGFRKGNSAPPPPPLLERYESVVEREHRPENLLPGIAVQLAGVTGLAGGGLGGMLMGANLGRMFGLPSVGLLAGGMLGGALGLAVGIKATAMLFD